MCNKETPKSGKGSEKIMKFAFFKTVKSGLSAKARLPATGAELETEVEPDVPIGLGFFRYSKEKPVGDNGLHLPANPSTPHAAR